MSDLLATLLLSLHPPVNPGLHVVSTFVEAYLTFSPALYAVSCKIHDYWIRGSELGQERTAPFLQRRHQGPSLVKPPSTPLAPTPAHSPPPPWLSIFSPASTPALCQSALANAAPCAQQMRISSSCTYPASWPADASFALI